MLVILFKYIINYKFIEYFIHGFELGLLYSITFILKLNKKQNTYKI